MENLDSNELVSYAQGALGLQDEAITDSVEQLLQEDYILRQNVIDIMGPEYNGQISVEKNENGEFVLKSDIEMYDGKLVGDYRRIRITRKIQ